MRSATPPSRPMSRPSTRRSRRSMWLPWPGHTALRNNHMDRLDRAATAAEIEAMRAQLIEALDHGALGLSSGLAYGVGPLRPAGGNFVAGRTPCCRRRHLRHAHAHRSGGDPRSHERSFSVPAVSCHVPVVISHLKCAGIANWGRSGEILSALETARANNRCSATAIPTRHRPAPSICARSMSASAS